MAEMTIKIYSSGADQYIDITPYIANDGLKLSRNGLDGPNAGRSLNGKMIRDRIAIKDKIEISCRPLDDNELNILINLVEPETITVEFFSPRDNGIVRKNMYSGDLSMSYLFKRKNTTLWSGISFSLVEI